jgi:hypothetical protein
MSPAPRIERKGGKIKIAGVKQSCGCKCTELVDWLIFVPLPQTFGKDALRFLDSASGSPNLYRFLMASHAQCEKPRWVRLYEPPCNAKLTPARNESIAFY